MQKMRVDEDDLDDLDDVLDQFSGTSATSAPQPEPSPAVASTSAVDTDDETNQDLGKEFTAQMDTFIRNLRGDVAADRESVAPSEATHLEGTQMPPSEITAQMEAFLKYLGTAEYAEASERELAAAWENVEGISGPANNRASTKASSAGSKQDDFQSRIRSTMNKLKESESGLKSSDPSPSFGTDLESMLSQLGLSGAEDGAEDEAKLQGMLEEMMGQLMSKEVLYEPLKELDGKFPEYLSKNSSSISPQDNERFEAQRSCIKRLLIEFEAPKYKDDDEQTRKKIVDLMGELQAHGSPPEEIMGPLPPGFNMGTDGLPDMPDDCKVN